MTIFYSKEFDEVSLPLNKRDEIVNNAVNTLNQLTEEQKQAVILYAKANYDEGYSRGWDSCDNRCTS